MLSKKSLTPIECYEQAIYLLQQAREEFMIKVAEIEDMKEEFQVKIAEVDDLKQRLEIQLNTLDKKTTTWF